MIIIITIALWFTWNVAVSTIINSDVIYVIVCVVYRYKIIKVFEQQIIQILTALANVSHKLSIIVVWQELNLFTITRIVREKTEASDCTKINREFCNPNFAIAFI